MTVCPICGEHHATCGGPTSDPQDPLNPNRFFIPTDAPFMASPISTATWRSDRRLYIDKDGKTVTEKATATSASLLVGEGGDIPLARAKELGLVDDNGETVETPKTKADPAPAFHIEGLGDERVAALKKAKLFTHKKLKDASDDDLLKIEGMDADALGLIREATKD